MPTGYTADIPKGITFEQYAWSCARAFGALILMRDDPSDAPIPERFEPSEYNRNALADAKAKFAQLDTMSLSDAATAAQADYDAELARYATRKAERIDQLNKYDAMLAQVVKWEAPTPDHIKYREFMISQIRETIDWDCSDKYDVAPVRLSGMEWLSTQIAEARRSMAYHEKEWAAEVERTNNRNAWIQALRDSL